MITLLGGSELLHMHSLGASESVYIKLETMVALRKESGAPNSSGKEAYRALLAPYVFSAL